MPLWSTGRRALRYDRIDNDGGPIMLNSALKIVTLVFLLVLPGGLAGAQGQKPPAEAAAAAKELIATMRATDQFKAILPMVVQALKPAIVQGRAQMERDYDAIAK